MTDPEGRYRLDNIPPGTYSVVAWHEGVLASPRTVTVSSDGTTELDFAFR
jgi:hypothetical protein